MIPTLDEIDARFEREVDSIADLAECERPAHFRRDFTPAIAQLDAAADRSLAAERQRLAIQHRAALRLAMASLERTYYGGHNFYPERT